MCQGLLPSRRHIEKREDPGDEVGDWINLVPRGCIPFGQHQGCKHFDPADRKCARALGTRLGTGYEVVMSVCQHGDDLMWRERRTLIFSF